MGRTHRTGGEEGCVNFFKGAILSGGPIEHLLQGYALIPFTGRKPHYWKEDAETMLPAICDGGRVRYYRSACGLEGRTSCRIPALGVGNMQVCKHCARITKKLPTAKDRITFVGHGIAFVEQGNKHGSCGAGASSASLGARVWA